VFESTNAEPVRSTSRWVEKAIGAGNTCAEAVGNWPTTLIYASGVNDHPHPTRRRRACAASVAPSLVTSSSYSRLAPRAGSVHRDVRTRADAERCLREHQQDRDTAIRDRQGRRAARSGSMILAGQLLDGWDRGQLNTAHRIRSTAMRNPCSRCLDLGSMSNRVTSGW
jgi:hypothetical protein